MVTCGIDWAQDHHDIAIVDTDGRLVAKRRIPESVAGFAELTAMLADAGDDPEDPIPVAIETPRGLLVAVLRASGRPTYPINPMSVVQLVFADEVDLVCRAERVQNSVERSGLARLTDARQLVQGDLELEAPPGETRCQCRRAGCVAPRATCAARRAAAWLRR
jgi:Transposase